MSIESLNELPATRAYLARIGAEPRSLKTAVVKETRGKYWKDLASINFTRNGTIEVSNPAYTPTDSEAAAIVAEFAAVRWPLLKPLMRIINPPDMIANANAESVFEFRDETSAIVFVQVRIETAEGKNIFHGLIGMMIGGDVWSPKVRCRYIMRIDCEIQPQYLFTKAQKRRGRCSDYAMINRLAVTLGARKCSAQRMLDGLVARCRRIAPIGA